MRLENILALTNGSLVSKPFVHSFNSIIIEAKTIKRGDLFLAFDEKEIDIAILNGAYGIIFSKPTQISDDEIAWIKVDDLENALKRLLRFNLINKKIAVYECNKIVLKLALQISTQQNFVVIDGDIKSIFNSLWGVENESTILFCPALVDKNIFTKTIELSQTSFKHINIIEQTLFETSFIYEDVFYERQLISPFFIPFLEVLLYLFKRLNISYRLCKFTQIEHFEAVFTNKNFEIKDFGTSDKVLIFEKDISLIEAEILFLQREAAWARIAYVMPFSSSKLIKKIIDTDQLIIYKNVNEIMNLLKKSKFHFALLMGVDKSILSKPLSHQTQFSLFDFK